MDELHLADDWRAAIERARGLRRILVLGATDMGKTSFIAALAGGGEPADTAEPALRLIDLDPGQKMLGPPGAATMGKTGRLERLIFLGSTSASNLGGIARAAAALAEEAGASGSFVVNTAGFVTGLGARLQAITATAVRPDLVIEIGSDSGAPPIVPPAMGAELIRLQRSPLARRKSPAARAALRQRAFAEALWGAELHCLEVAVFHPAPPAFPPGPARPVCAIADEAGEDMVLGILAGAEDGAALVHAPLPPRPPRLVRLGKMWAEPDGSGGWRLLEKLSRSWQEAG